MCLKYMNKQEEKKTVALGLGENQTEIDFVLTKKRTDNSYKM